jgi:hypothetical protein
MLLFYNLKGLGMFVLALGVALGAAIAFGLNGPPFHYLLGGVISILDLGYRHARVRPRPAAPPAADLAETRWEDDLGRFWLTSNQGGSLMLLPAWLFGLLYPHVLSWIASS